LNNNGVNNSETIQIHHSGKVKDLWSSWTKHGYTQEYVPFDVTVPIPPDGTKKIKTKVQCPACNETVTVITRSQQSVMRYTVTTVTIYVVIFFILIFVGAGMLSVFMIFPGLLLWGGIFESVKKIEVVGGGAHKRGFF